MAIYPRALETTNSMHFEGPDGVSLTFIWLWYIRLHLIFTESFDLSLVPTSYEAIDYEWKCGMSYVIYALVIYSCVQQYGVNDILIGIKSSIWIHTLT